MLSAIIKEMVGCIPLLLDWQANARNYCIKKFGMKEADS
ncbi:hypothetical protein CCP3SC1_790018 [Gammaproteobacteria bacterium]